VKRLLSGRLLLVGAAAIISWTAVSYFLTNSSFAPRCFTKACTYINHGVAIPGRCGAKDDDPELCYCIAGNGAGSQPQSGCSIPKPKN
jgi:hypothetical protein